ncbi:MAG: T9SS type A sorting domain-containing protein [candidate division Zixibacteria bacterium]|nr:T9SS type A sorting domain-containing protein [candidate division Zixibacteria bacterium]
MKKLVLIFLFVGLPLQGSNLFAQFDPPVYYYAGDGPNDVFSADFDGDNDNDLAVTKNNDNNVTILINNGDGTFQAPVNYAVNYYTVSLTCKDFDGDNDIDIAATYQITIGKVCILLNNGDGTFYLAYEFSTGDDGFAVFSSDLDGDNDYDLMIGHYLSDSLSILFNNGDATFQSPVYYPTGGFPMFVCSYDLNGDNANDLAVVNNDDYTVSIFLNHGNGTFQPSVTYGVGGRPRTIFATDLDGDEDNDLAVTIWSTNNISILLNNGNGAFQPAVYYGAGIAPDKVFSADFDIDNDMDLAVSNCYDSTISIFLNNGDGTFPPAVNLEVAYNPTSVFSADFNGDNSNDLAVTIDGYTDSVAILLNTSDGFCLVCDAISQSPRVPNENGTISWDLEVLNCGTISTPIYAEIYPTVGDCASGTQYDYNINRLAVSNLSAGDYTTLYYWYRPGTVTGVVDAAINVDIGPAINNYISNCCFEFIFNYEFGRPGTNIVYDPGEWGERDNETVLPASTRLNQNYPNPFNATTTISFDIVQAGNVNLSIYNLSGQKVETLTDNKMEAGQHNITWDASVYSSGIYFYKLTSDGKMFTKRMTLLK